MTSNRPKDGTVTVRLPIRLLEKIDREARSCDRTRSYLIESTLSARFMQDEPVELWDIKQVGLETGLTRRRIEGLLGRCEFPRAMIVERGKALWRASDVRDWERKNLKEGR